MPELPDVEVYRKYLNSTALHQPVEKVHVESPSILKETSPQALGRALKHKAFNSIDRHGKYLFISISDEQWLVMHFGMTGDIKYFQEEAEVPDYSRLVIDFENGYHLAYIAPRKLGRISLTDSPEQWLQSHELGPDAFEISEEAFIEQARNSRGAVKSWLMNQKLIAGIGNVYSDEILFHAGIHPKTPLKNLSKGELKELYKTMHKVLTRSISAHADPEEMPADFLLPHRKKDDHCPACDTPLKTVKAAGRTAWYCPHCQPG